MEMQVSPNRWSCTLASFAMALDLPLSELAKEIGHDGSEIIFPSLDDPERRRAFHVQEFVVPCHKRGFALVSVEAYPVLGAAGNNFHPIDLGEERLVQFLYNYTGVVIGEIRGHMHACAWNRETCFDPAGYCHGLQELAIREFLALLPIANPISG